MMLRRILFVQIGSVLLILLVVNLSAAQSNTGAVKLVGPPGYRGKVGGTGPRGRMGKMGDRGRPGQKGMKGSVDPNLYRGPMGMKGLKGAKGEECPDTGSCETSRSVGARGLKGMEGFRGTIGVKGGRGNPGLRGETGIVGQKGRTGQKGMKGEPVRNPVNLVFQSYTDTSGTDENTHVSLIFAAVYNAVLSVSIIGGSTVFWILKHFVNVKCRSRGRSSSQSTKDALLEKEDSAKGDPFEAVDENTSS